MEIKNKESVELDGGCRLILSALVGSRAHGLHTVDSDYDWRGVYIGPTSDILKLGTNPKNTKWIEGAGVDDTSYELGHFLHLATKSNPAILEIFCSPEYDTVARDMGDIGGRLLELFPYVWSSTGVYNAFRGYSKNQEKKFLDRQTCDEERRWKYAVAYIRTLQLGIDLLHSRTMNIEITDKDFKHELVNIKNGRFTVGYVVDRANKLNDILTHVYENNKDKETDVDAVNDFLLNCRKNYW